MLNTNVEAEAKAYQEIIDHAIAKNGCSWGAVVRQDDGSLKVETRNQRPCWGELRRYKDGTRSADMHPGDIPRVIAKGQREAIAVALFSQHNDQKTHNEIIEAIFGPDSPWKAGGVSSFTLHKNGNGKYTAASTHETNFDPTVLLNLLVSMKNRSWQTEVFGSYDAMRAAGMTPVEAYVMSFFYTRAGTTWTQTDMSYCLAPQSSIRRMLEQRAFSFHPRGTWRSQEDYNRPQLQDIFVVDNRSGYAATRFQKHTGSPNINIMDALAFHKQETFA